MEYQQFVRIVRIVREVLDSLPVLHATPQRCRYLGRAKLS